MIYCETCEKERKHYRVRTAYACDRCGHHIYPLAGTIFEKSTTPLRAMYLMGSTRCVLIAGEKAKIRECNECRWQCSSPQTSEDDCVGGAHWIPTETFPPASSTTNGNFDANGDTPELPARIDVAFRGSLRAG